MPRKSRKLPDNPASPRAKPDVTSHDLRLLSTLKAIMAALRTPVTGCPWDLEQDFRTIAPYTIEEAYEVADAIERNDLDGLREELGDLLLQVVYHSRLAEEQNEFVLEDVIEAISKKMVRRHPHVFGDQVARSAPLAKGFWEDTKARERDGNVSDSNADKSVLAGVPLALPALTRAKKLQAKAARAGFDWPAASQVIDKIEEETGELREALVNGDGSAIGEELGDLLFALVNLSRHLDSDPEASLRAACMKFERRFRRVEEQLRGRGKSPMSSTLEEMDALWEAVKVEESGED